MRSFMINTLMAILIIHSVRIRAQTIESNQLPTVWNLEQCIAYSKQQNIQINTLRLTTKSTEQDLLLSKAAKQPNLLGNASQTFTNAKNADLVVGGFQTQSSFAGNYSLGSSMVLYNGGYLNNDVRQKELFIKSAQFNADAAQNSITILITQAYLTILLAKENSVYLNEIVTTSKAQLKLGELKYNAGSIAKKDFVLLKAQLATDNYNLVVSQNNERQNTLTLKQLLQLPSGYNLNIQKPENLTTTLPVINLEDAQKIALEQRPEIKSSLLEKEAADLELLKSKASFKPTLTASGTLASGYSDNLNTPFVSQLDNNFYQRVGLSLTIPVFNNRIARTSVEKSKIAIDQSKLDLTNTETVLSQEVEQAYINVLNAQSQFTAANEQLDANTENYRIANEQLRLGGINTVDYLLEKNLYVQAFQSFIQAKYNAVVSLKIYDFYKGDPIKL
ncbi:TolC family protein [Flavobacterium sp. LS1R47]|uniref:TolC family protein n=1 Tax=Flavobacterium frigoritolerans TaxID=2987686 RepID=A0A9X3C228_9FLAO|nr:TolC family protein [Flavobacterium frigoritolerans]MCV9933506.1 TolC family protein [Flavobacterium frigoritolerans]